MYIAKVLYTYKTLCTACVVYQKVCVRERVLGVYAFVRSCVPPFERHGNCVGCLLPAMMMVTRFDKISK